MSQERQIFSLKQVVSSIRKTLETRYQESYWVKAEMHKLNAYPSGHAFPELVQKEDDKIVAQITATIWKDNLNRINKAFAETVKEPLREGLTLLMEVKIVFSELYGLSLQIIDIDPNFTLGALQREREETLKRLQKEGLINLNQSLNFPLLPKRIAVISADSSKGLSDFNQVLLKNSWNYQFFTFLFPAYLQGDMAIPSIMGQLERIKKVVQHFDLVVIVRGGGGEVGMSCYNHFELCKAIATFPLPVLTGIGHSTNLTVAEMIAFRNAITPTELADFLIQAFHDFAIPVQEASQIMTKGAQRILEQTKTQFASETKLFRNVAELFISQQRFNLSDTTKDFRNEVRAITLGNKARMTALQGDLKNFMENLLKQTHEHIKDHQHRLPLHVQRTLNTRQTELIKLEHATSLLDPVNVLKRGYSIVRYNGQTIKKGNEPLSGDRIELETEHDLISATVEASVKKTNND